MIYLETEIGLKHDNLDLVRSIYLPVRMLGMAYVIFGDFNVTPQELADNGYVTRLQGTIVTTTGVTSTCTSGSERMLDYTVM